VADVKQGELLAEIERLRARIKELESGGPEMHATTLAIADSLADNIMVFDREGRIEYINWTVPDLTPEQVIGTPVFQYVPAGSRANIERCLARVLESGEPDRYETEYVSAGGALSQWESRVTPVRRDGSIVGFAVISSNVTERREGAADRERFFDLSIDLLAMNDASGHFTRTNSAFERVLGHTAQELQSEPFLSFVHPNDREKTLEATRRLEAGEVVLDFENRFRRKDGSYRWISWRAVADPERRVTYGVGRDVTEQKALESQLRGVQRMDAVGQLAGGVAHDFNNLLLAIQANTELAARELSDWKRKQHLVEVLGATKRAAELTRQLLSFSRSEPINVAPLDLNRLISELMKLLMRLIPENIEFDFVAAPSLAWIDADSGQIEQVIVNLCVNARDAMPDGGKLTIETENLAIGGEGRDAHRWIKPGRYVVLSVNDTGVGMSAEVRERAFEPFFTTKESGRGTGLGLATVYAIVEKHGGTLEVESELNRGTTLKLYLPETERRVEEAAPRPERELVGGTETILIAEDNDVVRGALAEILEDVGYAVLPTKTGEEAVLAFRTHRDKIALALFDVVMPKLTGPEACAQIRALSPGFPVIFTSGYGERLERLTEADAVLRKPYQPEEVVRCIRDVLDRRPHHLAR
jgi:two-component system, cell cycle sensor histidine kinase and response regulator CckA